MSTLSSTGPEKHAGTKPYPVVVWFRSDLRVGDNPALHAAAETGQPVLPVFIWAPEDEGDWPPGAASRWWLHHSLAELGQDLRTLGARLTLRRGAAARELPTLCRETGATAVFYSRRYEPAVMERDEKVEKQLETMGVSVRSFNSSLLHEPREIRNRAGKPFQVFTPYWRACLAAGSPPLPLPKPRRLKGPDHPPDSLALESLELLPRHDWAAGLRESWRPGEAGAQERMEQFIGRAPARYDAERDHPALDGTSMLSPHLHFGEVSPRQVWHASELAAQGASGWQRWQFITELGWREFGHHLLTHFPTTPTEPLRAEFRAFPWRKDPARFQAWKHGRTGCPLVDAGMRQLWQTGWMHNRVRMVVASYLVKNLLIPWQEGARWFWDTLVDADLANNTLGWQWTAGCGADAAPFFRIFNPATQGQKFDSRGEYVRRWVPELAAAPSKLLFGTGPNAGKYGAEDYPEPIVSPFASRVRALEAYTRMRRG